MTIGFVVLAIVLVGAALGSLINFGFAFFAIPIVLAVFTGWVLTAEGMQRQRRIMQMKKFRQSARAQKVDFTAEDKRTVV
jgi:uncharacterized membrane protein